MPSVSGSAIAPEKYLRGRATCSLYIADCMTATGVGTDVLARCERAIADFEELTRRLPADVDLWVDLANGHRMMCEFLWSVDRARARQRRSFRKADAIYERLARENPTVTNIRRLWAATLTGTTATRSSLFELKERLNYLKSRRPTLARSGCRRLHRPPKHGQAVREPIGLWFRPVGSGRAIRGPASAQGGGQIHGRKRFFKGNLW